MILAHLCDEPKGLKTNMCMVRIRLLSSRQIKMFSSQSSLTLSLAQSLLYLPFALANALTARLNDGYVYFLSFSGFCFVVFIRFISDSVNLFSGFLLWMSFGFFLVIVYSHCHYMRILQPQSFMRSQLHLESTASGQNKINILFLLTILLFKFTKI